MVKEPITKHFSASEAGCDVMSEGMCGWLNCHLRQFQSPESCGLPNPDRHPQLCAPAPTTAAADAQRVGFSHSAKSVVAIQDWVQQPELAGRPLVFVLGAFAHGKVSC